MQCLAFKLLPTESGCEIYRAVFSDGQYWIQCVLPARTSSAEIARQGQIAVRCVCRLKEYQLVDWKNKGYVLFQAMGGESRAAGLHRHFCNSILAIRNLEVLHALGVPEKIGQPSSAPAPVLEFRPEEWFGPQERAILQPRMRDGALIYPIEALSPFLRNWTIKAQVTSKPDICTPIENSTDAQEVLSVNLHDDTGEIKASYSGPRYSELNGLLQEGSIYYISSPCKVLLIKEKFNFRPDDFKLEFNADTIIERAED